MKVRKTSGKPFKSGKLINTVKATVINEQDPLKRQAYLLDEDDSIVNCDVCEVVADDIEITTLLNSLSEDDMVTMQEFVGKRNKDNAIAYLIDQTGCDKSTANDAYAYIIDNDPFAALFKTEEAEPVITMSEAVAIMKEKVDEQKNLYLRAVADLTNYKRNAEKTIADSKMNGEINVLKALLPILDDIDRAASAGDGDNPIYKKLQSSVQSIGLECIEPLLNTPFNVDEQCAVMTQPAEGHEVNTIAGIITPGYRYKNTMIRYANVVVYA